MITVRYYTDGTYKGWEKFKLSQRRAYENWIISGNTLKVGGTHIATIPELATALYELEMN